MTSFKRRSNFLLFFFALFAVAVSSSLAYLPTSTHFSRRSRAKSFVTNTASRSASVYAGTTTVEAPTKERTDRSTRTDTGVGEDDYEDDDSDLPYLEYLIDPTESREMEDPFHILLLGSTFEKPKISVSYVSGSLEYVLNMPYNEAKELSLFAKDEGLSCLGTWPREECLSLGKQLQRRDIVCRVVPYCEGGQRGWQAKDASNSAGNNQYSNNNNNNNRYQ